SPFGCHLANRPEVPTLERTGRAISWIQTSPPSVTSTTLVSSGDKLKSRMNGASQILPIGVPFRFRQRRALWPDVPQVTTVPSRATLARLMLAFTTKGSPVNDSVASENGTAQRPDCLEPW